MGLGLKFVLRVMSLELWVWGSKTLRQENEGTSNDSTLGLRSPARRHTHVKPCNPYP